MLQHGLISLADTWIENEPSVAVAYQFARAGYDVWLGNNRGNKYSMNHRTISASENPETFYDYSFQDLGQYDLPAQIDKVREVSRKEKITYVGHSQGTAQMFYALSTNEDEIAKKVNLFVAFAPIVRFQGMSSLLKSAQGVNSYLKSYFQSHNIHSLFGPEFD